MNAQFFMPVEFKEEQKTYNPSNWNSIFIPSLPSYFADEIILSYLIQEVFKLGSVKRVDIIKKENMNNRLMAFIHFNHWFDNTSVASFRGKMDKDGMVDIFGYIDEQGRKSNYALLYDKNLRNDMFLKFLINKTPIKETELNIHQLADVLEKAEQKIRDQRKMIKELQMENINCQLQIDNLIIKNKLLEEPLKSITNLIKNPSYNNLYVSVCDEKSMSLIDELENNPLLERPKLIRELYVEENPEEYSMMAYNIHSELSSCFDNLSHVY